MVVITLGLWLLIIPFYPARCINCGMTRGSAFWENLKSNPRMAVTTSSVLFGLVVVFVIFRAMTPESAPNYHGISDAVHESASAVPEPRGSDLHGWEPAAPSPQLPALSSDELQTLKDGRQYDLELIAAVNAVLMAPSPNDAITAYCRFTMKGVRELTGGPSNEWLDQQKIAICRGRVLTGLTRMPSLEQFREYGEKARLDLIETDQKLKEAGIVLETESPKDPPRTPQPVPTPPLPEPEAAPPAPPPVESPKIAAPTSGVLHAMVETEHGDAVFENLPADRLKFTFDHDAWQATTHRQPNGTKTLVMHSLKPGSRISCDVRWEIVQ